MPHERDEQLRLSEARYRLATEVAQLGTWTWDVAADVASFDAHIAELFGFDHSAPGARVEILSTRVHAEDRARVDAALAGAMAPGGDGRYRAEFRVVRPDGTERWVRAAGQMQFEVDPAEHETPTGVGQRPVFLVGTAVDVTPEHAREAALRKAVDAEKAAREAVDAERARLDRVVAQLPAPVAVYEGPELRFRALSAAYQRIIGGREVVGRPIRDALPELSGGAQGADFFALMQRVFDSGETVAGTNERARWDDNADGITEEHVVDLIYTPLLAADGERVEGVIALILDVTARARAESALRESEARFRATADAAPVVIWTTGTDGECDWVNRAWIDFTGSAGKSSLGAGWTKRIHHDDSQSCLEIYQKAFAARESYTLELRLRRHDGVYRHFLVNAVPRYAEGELAEREFVGYIGTCADVTELREARQEAEAARAVASALVESVRDAFVAFDADFRFTYVNTAAQALLATSSPSVSPVGQILWEAYPHVLGTKVEEAMRRAMTERIPVHFDTHDPAHRRWFASRVYPAVTGGLTAVWTDVTQERRAREADAFLADASRALAASLDYASTLRALADAAVPRLGDWCAIDMVQDPAASRWPPEVKRLVVVHEDPAMLALSTEIMERYPTDWSAADGLASVLRNAQPFFLPEITDTMVVAGARDDEHLAMLRALHFSSILVVPLVARGLTLGALTLCMTESDRRYDEADRDLALNVAHQAALAVDNARLFQEAEQARLDAELARLEAERQRAEAEAANQVKMQFLSTMSHELRTPLHAIGGYTEMLALELRGPVTEAQREDLDRVRAANQYLLALVNDVLNFARVDSGHLDYELADVSLAQIVADLEPLVLPQITAKGIAFDYDGCAAGMTDTPQRVRADREKLRQILLNLLSNAVKFTPAGGRVKLSCETDEGANRTYIRVTDTGGGIPADQAQRIFEPFVQIDRHRTPESQQGVGLGLAISRELARHMGGDLRVESSAGTGATLLLIMPTREFARV